MDQFLSRQEIRRLVRSIVGDSTDELVSGQQTEGINAQIDAAAVEIAGMSRWLSLQRRAELALDINQEVLGYEQIEQAYWLEQNYSSFYMPLTYGTAADSFAPAGLATANLQYVGPGNIIKVAIWNKEARQWYNLPKNVIPVDVDLSRGEKEAQEGALLDTLAGLTTTKINANIKAATATSVADRGIPVCCEARIDGVHLWPRTDVRRVIRIAYVISPSWEYHQQVLTPAQIDQIPSSVDGQAIIHAVCSDIYAQQGDQMQSMRYRNDEGYLRNGQRGTGKFWNRIRELKGYQNTGESVPLDDTCTFDQDSDRPERTIPRWDLSPRQRT